MKVDWKGVYPVIVTPFDKDGAIQEDSLRQLTKILVGDGIHGLVVAASSGEYYVMTHEERLRVFQIVLETVRDAAPELTLMANTTAIYTEEAVDLSKKAGRMGYDGVMLLPPYYATPSNQMVLEHYERIAGSIDLPIMLYNAPKWTGVDLDVAFLEKLVRIDNICAVKESSRNVEQLLEILRLYHDDLRVFIGLETLIVPAMVLGADGVVAMAAQALGRRIVDLYDHCVAGRWEEARKLQYDVSLVYRYSSIGTHYAALKELINQAGRPAGYPRRPLKLPDDTQKAEIRKLLQAVGVIE